MARRLRIEYEGVFYNITLRGNQREKDNHYLCKILKGKKNAEMGTVFNITFQAVTNAVRDI